MVGSTCCDPALHAGGKAGLGLPHNPSHRKIRHRHNGLDAVDILADQAQTAAHVNQGHYNGVALLALKHQPGRIKQIRCKEV